MASGHAPRTAMSCDRYISNGHICARVDQERKIVICSVGQCIKWLLQYEPDVFVAATVYLLAFGRL